MNFRNLFCLASLFLCASHLKADDSPWSLSGMVINTTNPKKAVQSTATISFKGNECFIRVDSPLTGSGTCAVSKIDKDSGVFILQTEGPAGDITFDGVTNGENYSGHFTVSYPNFKELPQSGTFHFHSDAQAAAFTFGDVLKVGGFDKDGKHYKVLRERDMAYIYDKDFHYQNIRIILDAHQNASIRIEDHPDGSDYIDVSSTKLLMRWHCDGINGYYEKPVGTYSDLYDHFMQPTNWSSFISSGTTFYAYTRGAEVELYDSDFNYLHVHSSATTTGKTLWLKDDKDGTTEYYDKSFNPLNWYSLRRGSQTYYAHIVGKKVTLYDASMRQIRKEHPFWHALGQNLTAGLTSYGQALQAQAQTTTDVTTSVETGYTTTNSGVTTYNTTSQQIGNTIYSNTTGSNGYSAQETRQQIGDFGYINGTSSGGAISGNTQQIGNFNYGNYTTSSGQWNATTQQIGNIEYHTLTAPDGSVHMGTSQRVGDFVYTNIQ